MLSGKKTVASILAPFEKMKADLTQLIEDRRKAIGTRQEKILVLKIENEADEVEIARASDAAERISELTL